MCVYRETELFRFENEVISDKVLQFIGLLAKTAFTTKVMMDCNIGECELDECLVHAAECHRDHHACESKLCGLLKSKIAHHRDCPVDQYCAECLEIIDLCMRHALECGKGPGECKVPYCDSFRRRVDSSLTRPSPERTQQLLDALPDLIHKAADAVVQADVILLLTGAGFSSDSGLPVYKDVANVKAYRDAGLSYQDLCQPEWIDNDLEIFYGFWGMCFNDYREATPHEGYQIIQRWLAKRFAVNTAAREIQLFVSSMQKDANGGEMPANASLPTAFFSVTSNVDEHFRAAGFPSNQLWEIHGDTETWQCSAVCTEDVWRAPPGYRFRVDKETMRAPAGPPASPGEGDTRGFGTNHPTCKRCGAPARPAVLFFGDSMFVPDDHQRQGFVMWMEAVRDLASVRNLSLVIIEIGAGNRVPTIRDQAHTILRAMRKSATLIRINPDFPVPPEDLECQTISIMAKGLDTLREIDRQCQTLDRRLSSDVAFGSLHTNSMPSILQTAASVHSVGSSDPACMSGTQSPGDTSSCGSPLSTRPNRRTPPPARKYSSISPYTSSRTLLPTSNGAQNYDSFPENGNEEKSS